jgi:hypothetical protein
MAKLKLELVRSKLNIKEIRIVKKMELGSKLNNMDSRLDNSYWANKSTYLTKTNI